ncbi:MAG: DUF418 domain-containing protein [Balneolaceae bacterium]|nr:MAG: DUF418 domain-containing protein [Balneolaceae bacterium]
MDKDMESSKPQDAETVAKPVASAARITDLDILRGIALFGILIVNLYIFANPIAIVVVNPGPWTEWYNQAALFFTRVFFEGKFITMFSFLFGIGFYIFTERLKLKGMPVRRVFFRRMILLLFMGLIHGVLLWPGDILVPYALCGLFLLFFLYRKEKTIRVWIGLILGGFLILFTLMVFFIMWGLSMPDISPGIKQGFAEANEGFLDLLARGYEVYAAGQFSEILNLRWEELAFVWTGLLFTPMGFIYITAIFLFGFLIGRQGLLENPGILRSLLIPRRHLFTVTGFLLSVVYAFTYYRTDPVLFNYWSLIQMYTIIIGAPLLMLGYSGFILFWLEENRFSSFLNRFAPVGRMALTNYIMQTLICVTLFYGYGFGLIGRVEPVYLLPIGMGIYIFQMAWSEWYFERYKMGPLERLWRMGTYMKRV